MALNRPARKHPKGGKKTLLVSLLLVVIGSGFIFAVWGHSIIPMLKRHRDQHEHNEGQKKHAGALITKNGGAVPFSHDPTVKLGDLKQKSPVPKEEDHHQDGDKAQEDHQVAKATKPAKKKKTPSPKPNTDTGPKKFHARPATHHEKGDTEKGHDDEHHDVDINQQVFSWGQPPPNAYMMIISNEDFIDGALVLGTSLRSNSEYLSSGKAHLVILVASGRLGADSKYRLRYFGFDRIVEIKTLADQAPGAALKDTFDKLYMFNLTAYKKVVFMDADMLNVKGADDLFEKDSYFEEGFVGGIGHHGTGGYFQTGMLVFKPSTKVFDRVMEEFNAGTPPRGQKYNRGMMGRDGVLIRNVFMDDFKVISDNYSRNLNPRNKFAKELRSLHFRGKFKPWMNRILPNPDPEMGKKEFGFGYVRWWEVYHQQIHQRSPEYIVALHKEVTSGSASKSEHNRKLLEELVMGGAEEVEKIILEFKELTKADLAVAQRTLKKYGEGAFATLPKIPRPVQPAGDRMFAPTTKDPLKGHLSAPHLPLERQGSSSGVFSPITRLWMMRNTKKHYVQESLLTEKFVRHFAEPKGYKLVVGGTGDSCNAACGGRGLRCLSDYLHHSKLQSCEVLQEAFGDTVCTNCQVGVYWRHHPGNEMPSVMVKAFSHQGGSGASKGTCFFNLLHDDRTIPTCDAYFNTTKRLCPCAPESAHLLDADADDRAEV